MNGRISVRRLLSYFFPFLKREKKGRREVYLMGSITEVEVYNRIQEILRLHDEAPGEEITLYVSSLGGDFDLAVSFVELVRTKNINLKTIALGAVSSSSVLIFLAGKERIVTSNSHFHLHELSKRLNGSFTSSEIIRLAEDAARGQHVYNSLIKERTRLSLEVIKEIVENDAYLESEEALECGFAHRIV